VARAAAAHAAPTAAAFAPTAHPAASGIYTIRLCPCKIYTYYSAFESFHSHSCLFRMGFIGFPIGCGESGLCMN